MKDLLIRAVSTDGKFRILSVSIKNILTQITINQDLYPFVAALCGELLSCAILMSGAVKGGESIGLSLEGDDLAFGGIMVEAWSDGRIRAFIKNGHAIGSISELLKNKTTLKCVRFKEDGKTTYTSIYTFQNISIPTAVTEYMFQSEQIPSLISTGYKLHPTDIISNAGGFIIQPLGRISNHNQNELKEYEDYIFNSASVSELLDGNDDPKMLLAGLLKNNHINILSETELKLFCTCNEEKIKEVRKIAKESETTEVKCMLCGKKY